MSGSSLFRKTSGGHSRSLASLGHGHFVAGPRFPSPALLISAAIAPPHPSRSLHPPPFLPPSLLSPVRPLPYSLIRTFLALFLPFARAFSLSSTRAALASDLALFSLRSTPGEVESIAIEFILVWHQSFPILSFRSTMIFNFPFPRTPRDRIRRAGCDRVASSIIVSSVIFLPVASRFFFLSIFFLPWIDRSLSFSPNFPVNRSRAWKSSNT